MTATLDQLATTISDRISRGELAPGTRLSEVKLAGDLGVSRNTLRESFRALTQDGLIEHIPNRGVFVRKISPREVVDLFAFRRFVELGALDYYDADPSRTTNCLAAMKKSCTDASSFASAGEWERVGDCNTEFHVSIVELTGIKQLRESLLQAMNVARLAYLTVSTTAEGMYNPFLNRNVEIRETLAARDVASARSLLRQYLVESEANILTEMSLGG